MVLAVLVSLALTAAHPAMFGSLPVTDDAQLHLNRLIALDYSVRHGDLWPRYAPVVAYGYGLPIFNYYSPLALYPMELLHLLGLSFLDAFLGGTILYTFFGLAGAYLLGKVGGGTAAGLVTAVAYAYAPYTLLSWPRRGAIPEFLGMALLVWAMWAFWQVAHTGRRRDLALAAGYFTSIILTHNITALLGAALLGVTSLVLWWNSPQPRRAFVHLALALILPLGLAAFFWVPAVLETRYIFIDRVSELDGALGFRNYFQTLGQVFAPPHTADLTRIQHNLPRSLSWPQLALAVTGGMLIARRGAREDAACAPLRRWLLLSAPLMAVLIFMTTPASEWAWRTLPFLPYFRYPWRMIGPASLLLAVAAGAGAGLVAQRIRRPGLRAAWVGLTLAILIVAGMPWLDGVYLPRQTPNSVVDAQNFERETGKLGGTSYREYVPIWTTSLPDEDRLIGLYAQSEVIPRLQPVPGVTVEEAAWTPLGADLTLEVAEATRLVFDWLYFPGWRAELDGAATAAAPVAPHGFVGVAVPAGEHHLRLRFGPTPLRRATTYVSLGTLALLATVMALPRLWAREAHVEESAARPGRSAALLYMAAALAGLLTFGGKVLVIDNVDTPIRQARSVEDVEHRAQTPMQADFGGAIRLLGLDMPRTSVRSGQSVPIVLYWTLADGMVGEDYSSNVVIRDAAGDIVWQALSFYPGGEPTTTWVPGFYVRESLTLTIPPGTPPGTYTVEAGIYSGSLGRNLDVTNAQGNPVGVLIELAELTVTRPRRPASAAELGLENPRNARLTPTFTLISASPPPAEAEVGQQLPVIWHWRAAAHPEIDVRARLVWLNRAGKVVARSASVPLVTGYATSEWQRRDVWRGIHVLHVPGRLDAGDYEVGVQLYDEDGDPLGKYALIGPMRVRTPPRSYFVPEMGLYAGVSWENGIRLLGYDLPDTAVQPGDGLSIAFYWQAVDEIMDNLTVFVHLVGANGEIVAQRDQIPASGARPTTGWAPREVVRDAYGLLIGEDVPPGVYRLRIGWYNATTGERVPVTDGDTFWFVPYTITVNQGP